MRVNWQLWSGALNKNTCEDLINTLVQIEPSDGKIFSTNEETSYRKSKVRWANNFSDIRALLWSYVAEANRNAFGFSIENIGDIQFTEYQASYKGNYDWHHDIDWNLEKAFDRKLTIVVQLTDPQKYKGGNFEFSEVQNPTLNDFKQQGSIIVFPSYLQHRVTEVTDGTRYSLVSWFEGPRWK